MLRGVLFVAVLGPVEVRRDGLGIRVPAGKPSELLVRLALDAGEPVRVDRLIEDLWGDQAVTVGRNTLQSKVSQLRRVLGDPALLTGDSAGYALALEPDQVDAHHVLRLAEAAGATRRSGDAEATLATCTEGLALFRGDELLPSGGSGGWLDPHRARLAEARLMLIEDQLAARSDLGGGAEIIGELERLVADHPLRESLWVLLITALYRSGRQADALAAYQRVQHTLAEELGLDPGPELQEVERKVLHHDQDLRPAPTSATPSVLAGNLPALSGSLVGRSADLGRVSTELAAARLVTVVGPAGVGKTRLAVEVARGIQLAGGCWLVRLEDAHDAASAWSAIAEALGLTAGTRPVVLDRLSAAEALLILDNCEHLAAPVAELALTLLGTAPGLRILATSQVALGLDGEVVHALAPLSLAESITLFATRAGQQRPGYDHDQRTGAAVEALCQSLDGLPLAIELAAARVKVLSVPEIARRIDDRFTLLSDPTGRRPARQRTLRAAIGWSYDLLFPDDQRGLWALSCFAGGAPLGAAEAVLAALGLPGTTVIDVLSRLIDRSLVLVDPASEGELRYRMLDSVRAFSLEQLTASGEAESARRAHATWYAEAAARTRAGVRGSEQGGHLALVGTERANIDQALAWSETADPMLGLDIVRGFGWAWVVLGAGTDGSRRMRAALAAAGEAAPAYARADALLLAGWLEASSGDLDQATADIEQAMALEPELVEVGRLHYVLRPQPAGQGGGRAGLAGPVPAGVRRARSGLGGGGELGAHRLGRDRVRPPRRGTRCVCPGARAPAAAGRQLGPDPRRGHAGRAGPGPTPVRRGDGPPGTRRRGRPRAGVRRRGVPPPDQPRPGPASAR